MNNKSYQTTAKHPYFVDCDGQQQALPNQTVVLIETVEVQRAIAQGRIIEVQVEETKVESKIEPIETKVSKREKVTV